MKIKNTYKKIVSNNTILNGVLYTFFSFCNTGVNFLLLLVLSKFLSPSEYGYLNLFNTIVLLLSILISCNTEKIICVDYYRVTKDYTSNTITSILLFSLGVGCLLSGLTIILKDIIALEFGFDVKYIIVAISYCICNLVSSVNLAIWKAESHPKSYGIYSLSIVFFNCIGTIILLIFFSLGWISRALSQFYVSVIFAIIGLFVLYKKEYLGIKAMPKWINLKTALHFGLPMIPNSISWWAMQGVNRFVINSHYGPAEVGLYSFATNFANILQIIGVAFAQSYHVDVYQKLSKKESGYCDYLKKISRKLIITFGVLAIIIVLFSYLIIPILFQNYIDSLKFLLPLFIGAYAHCVNLLFVCYLLYNKKTKWLMNITFVVSGLNVLLGVLFIQYNLLLAAYISMISEILIMITYMYYAYKLEKIKIV